MSPVEHKSLKQDKLIKKNKHQWRLLVSKCPVSKASHTQSHPGKNILMVPSLNYSSCERVGGVFVNKTYLTGRAENLPSKANRWGESWGRRPSAPSVRRPTDPNRGPITSYQTCVCAWTHHVDVDVSSYYGCVYLQFTVKVSQYPKMLLSTLFTV